MNLFILGQIFTINLVYIMLNTVRTLLTLRGYRYIAPFVAMIEIMIYTVGLSVVIKYINENLLYLIVYALGFGIGLYVGMLVEDRIALGYAVVQVFTEDDNHVLAHELRERGFGVTIQSGYGRDGSRLILTILTPRSKELTLRTILEELSPSSFYMSYEVKYIHGGFWSKRINRPQIEKAFDELENQDVIMSEEIISKKDYQDS